MNLLLGLISLQLTLSRREGWFEPVLGQFFHHNNIALFNLKTYQDLLVKVVFFTSVENKPVDEVDEGLSYNIIIEL